MEKIDYLIDKTNNLNSSVSEINNSLNSIETSVSTNQSNISTLQNNFDKLLNSVSNKNILINGNFQINQRGLGTDSSNPYTTTNATSYVKYYTFDRWAFVPQSNLSANNSIYKNNDGSVTISFGQQYVQFVQQLENSSQHFNKTYTCSIKVNSISNTTKLAIAAMDYTSGSGNQLAYSQINKEGIISFTFSTLSTTKDLRIRIMYAGNYSEDVTINLSYIKLEEGSIATKFVPNSYTEDLTACQRYYFKVRPNFYNYDYLTNIGIATSTSTILFFVPQTTQLRATPTVKINNIGIINIVSGSAISEAPTKSIRSTLSNFVVLRLYFNSTTLTKGTQYLLQCSAENAYVELDSEVY